MGRSRPVELMILLARQTEARSPVATQSRQVVREYNQCYARDILPFEGFDQQRPYQIVPHASTALVRPHHDMPQPQVLAAFAHRVNLSIPHRRPLTSLGQYEGLAS